MDLTIQLFLGSGNYATLNGAANKIVKDLTIQLFLGSGNYATVNVAPNNIIRT